MKSVLLGVLALMVSATVNVQGVSAQTGSQLLLRPGTLEAAEMMQKLKDAEYADRGNSVSFGDDPSLGHYYARKAVQVGLLIKRLAEGQPVSEEEIEGALDNNGARLY